MNKKSSAPAAEYERPVCILSECFEESVLCESPSGGMIEDVNTEDFTW